MKQKKVSNESAMFAAVSDPKNKHDQNDQSRKLHCLFCYKLVVHIVDDGDKIKEIYFEDKDNKKEQICNRFYSQVIIRKDGIRKGFSGEEEKLANKNCGVCDDCLYVIESHCKVYEEIEFLKLRLRWQLDKFHKVMKYAGKVPSRVKAFKDSFQLKDAGKTKEMETVLTNKLDEVLAFRRKIFGGCAARLKYQNLKVSLSPLMNSNTSHLAHKKNNEEDHVPDTPAEPEPLSQQQESENESESGTENIAGPSNLEMLYIIKTEDANGAGGQRHQRIVTPPESILDTIRSGEFPMEGVSKNHYFYCETDPVIPQSSPERQSNSNRDANLMSSLINPETEMNTKDDAGTSNAIYKCIRCSQKFQTAKKLISHAKENRCFNGENVREKSGENGPQSPKLKRKRTSEERNTNQSSAKKARNSTFTIQGSVKKNVVSNAINKVLTGLRSMFKCPNCSLTFPDEDEFKVHVFARECFKKTKKEKERRKQHDKNNTSESEGDSSDVDSSSSLSSSTHSGEDSDYAPNANSSRKFNPKEKKRTVDGRRKKRKPADQEVIKTRCSVENCAKFFLYKEDYERHLLHHGFFSCEFCHYTTDLATNLVNHELQQHSKKSQDGKKLCPRCRNKKMANEKHQQTDHYLRVHLFPVNKSSTNKSSRRK